MFECGKYVACIAEGSAEQAIIDILLDNNMLIFSREQLIEEKVLRCRSAESFESRYLRMGFEGTITVFRILDSRREKFRLSKAYQHKVDVINIVTAPEIEMLVVLKEGRYSDYRKSHLKPSQYCKEILRYRNVKSYDFVKEYFVDPNELKSAMMEYKRISKNREGENTLIDLLKLI